MKRTALLAFLFPALSLAATTATVTQGQWDLYSGSSRTSTHASETACVAAARARNVTSTYTCRTSTAIAVKYTRDPVAVNCVVSSWSAWTPGPAGLETRTRTVVTPAANGGTACPALSEQRAATTPGSGPTFTLSKYAYAGDDYVSASWSGGVAPCTASSSPAYTPWSGNKSGSGGQSLSPDYSVVLTIACANGSTSRSLTVTGFGSAPTNPTTPTTPTTPGTPSTMPTVTPLTTPLTRLPTLISSNELDTSLLKFSHTANQEWNFEGHNVAADFPEEQGNWSISKPGTYHAWLFDRPSSWFKLHQITGDASHLANAIRDTAYYASQINAAGYFIPKVNAGEADTKYGYVTPFLLYEKATGNAQYRAVAKRVYDASVTGYNASALGSLWTEREAGLHLEAALSYYQLTGDRAALNRAGAIIRQVGALAAANGGAPQVSYTQHEGGGPGGTTPTGLTNSPWMTALYFQAARTYWQITGDQAVLQQISAYFDWLHVNGLYDGARFSQEFAGVTMPRYLTGALIGDASYGEGDISHCLDVAGLVAFAVDAKRRLGAPTATAEARLTQLKACSVRAFNNWTRSTQYLPKYRIQTPRMWMWWMRGRFEL